MKSKVLPSAIQESGSLRSRILLYLFKSCNVHTDRQLQLILEVDDLYSVRRRTSELVKSGLLKDVGKVMDRSGRPVRLLQFNFAR